MLTLDRMLSALLHPFHAIRHKHAIRARLRLIKSECALPTPACRRIGEHQARRATMLRVPAR